MADSPVGYWRMDELSGFPQDSSGYGNHADQIIGTQTYAETGAITTDLLSTSIKFAGDGGFYLPDDPSLDLGDVLTVEAWVKLDAVGVGQAIFDKGPNAYSLEIDTDNTLSLRQSGSASMVNSTTALSVDGLFHHVVATKSGSTIKLYIDGVDVTGTVTNATLVDNALRPSIGSRRDGIALFMDGWLDELAVYNVALTYSQVLSHYHAGTSDYAAEVLIDDPVAYYRMNEETPFQTVLDTFSGGDENPITTNWTVPVETGDNNIRISGGKIISEFAGGISSAYYDVATFGPDCEVFATFVDDPNSADVYSLYLRLKDVGTATPDGYAVTIVPGATDQWAVFIITNGVGVEVGLYEGQEVNAGDSVGLTAIGTLLQMWYKASGGSWVPVGDARTDSTYPNAGYLGVKIQQGGATTVGLDSFGGGSGVVAFPQDSSGTSNHAYRVAGSPTYEDAGAIESDPTDTAVGIRSGGLDYWRVPNDSTLDLGDVFSLEGWVQRKEIVDGGESWFLNLSTAGGGEIGINANALYLAKSETAAIVGSTVPVQDLEWHHCVATKDGADFHLYLDGVDVTGVGTNATCISPGLTTNLGIEGPGYGSIPLYLDELAVYPTVLSAARVLAHYEAALEEEALAEYVTTFLSAIGW